MNKANSSRIYLDNASTTKLDIEVYETMLPYIHNYYGNASALDKYGRQAKVAIENARKSIANLLNVSPSEIFFVSGGTEANNMAIQCSIYNHNITDIVTSPIEHLSVINPIIFFANKFNIKIHYVKLDSKGNIDYNHLESIISNRNRNYLVSLMHGNNEIGNITYIKLVSIICTQYKAILHSDMVQTMGYYNNNLKDLNPSIATASAHKIHGPKGIGFIYIKEGTLNVPLFHGGSQERNMRAGTENISSIIGLAKALEISFRDTEQNKAKLVRLKKLFIKTIKNLIPDVFFNGNSEDLINSLYSLLNIRLPYFGGEDMLLYNMDIGGVSVSHGSACSSGSSIKSHVLEHLYNNNNANLRISFSKYNTEEEVEYACKLIHDIINRN